MFRLFLDEQFPEPALNPSGALLMGLGNSTVQPESDKTDKNWLSFFLKSTGASGTSRGMYLRLYLPNGAGGEALRVFNTVSHAAPADTVNGAHISLNFGSSAGNVTGESNAVRATYHLGNRSMTGTNSAVKAELWSDGASSADGGTMSFIRASLGGNSTGAAAVEDTAALIQFDGGTNASGNVIGALNGNEPTWTGKTSLVRCRFNGQTVYLVGIQL